MHNVPCFQKRNGLWMVKSDGKKILRVIFTIRLGFGLGIWRLGKGLALELLICRWEAVSHPRNRELRDLLFSD